MYGTAHPADPVTRIEAIRDRLLAREHLYDNPQEYREGVAAALDAVRDALSPPPARVPLRGC